MKSVKVFLFNKDGDVQYGLNWGQRGTRDPNEAYLQLTPEVYRSDFFPIKKHYFLVDADDGFSFVMNRVQKGEDGSALGTPEDNSLLGRYLRKRLGVPENLTIEKSAIDAYGRSDIDFIKVGDNHYKMDFSLSHSLISSTDVSDIDKPRNRIIFGAPGTGKSNRLSLEAKYYFPDTIGQDTKKKLYDEIHSQPADADQAEWITSLGIRYSTYIMENYIIPKKQNDLINDFDLLNDGEQTTKKKEQLVQGTKAAYRLHLATQLESNNSRIERVTFHPNYTYAQFVGTYKPITKTINDKEEITYEYVPGPFIRAFIKAKKTGQNVLLLIEEINRANVAAVFGDVFQLLDRDGYGNSEYPITTSEDLRKFLAKPENLGGTPDDYKTISLPSNMYIWATMNSADQGVFPMDTAFKRRWEFEYIGIDINEKEIANIYIPICKDKKVSQKVKWNDLRHAINNKLISLGINEDKLLGPFFLSKSVLESAMDKGKDFIKLFESKVLMYLFEDAAKMKVRQLFKLDNNKYIYSEVCKKFEKDGVAVFNFDDGESLSCEDIKTTTSSDGELTDDSITEVANE